MAYIELVDRFASSSSFITFITIITIIITITTIASNDLPERTSFAPPGP